MAVVIETVMGEDLDLGVLPTSKTHPSGGVLPGTQISLSTFALGGPQGEATAVHWAPPTIASGSLATIDVAVPGAQKGDKVLVSLDSMGTIPLLLTAQVSGDNLVTAVLANLTGALQALAQGTLSVLVFRTRVATFTS